MSYQRTVIEIGEHKCKVGRALFVGNNVCVDKLEHFNYENGFSLESLQKVFTDDLLSSAKSELIISLRRSFFMIRFLNLPTTEDVEIREMLPFQLAKQVPFPLDDILFDYTTVHKTEKTSEILVFVLLKKKIKPVLDLLEERSVKPAAITISSGGLANWAKNYTFSKQDFGTKGMVNIYNDHVEYMVLSDDGIIFSRSFSYEEEYSISEGLRHSLEMFKKNNQGSEPEKMFYTGIGLSDEEEIKCNFIDQFSSVESISDYKELKRKKTNKLYIEDSIKDSFKKSNVSFVSVLGLLAHKDDSLLDFATDSLKKYRKSKGQLALFKNFALIACQFVVFATMLSYFVLYNQNKKINWLNYYLKETKVELKEAKLITDKIRFVEQKAADKVLAAEILVGVFDIVPDKLKLVSFELSKNNEIHLKGYAPRMNVVFKFVNDLNLKSGLFKDVQAKYATKTKTKTNENIEFYISGKIRKNKS